MIAGENGSYTLEALSAEAARSLASRVGEPPDGRVSAAPDGRTIRYYATLGLVDRPSFEGRQARYGRRHLLQLVAIKALQGSGLPLAEIQARLYGRSDGELEAIIEAATGERRAARPAVRAVRWREVAVEPGLRLMAEEGWSPGEDLAALLEKLRAA
ncbi:MAG TPA: MerR family transcriptional regulator, partial [Planctomycetota bacterium]|nr:MerR family transcriptional regulator [Planctomycetota bacterium]